MVLVFSLVLFGLAGWREDWVLVYGGHDECLGLAWGLGAGVWRA